MFVKRDTGNVQVPTDVYKPYSYVMEGITVVIMQTRQWKLVVSYIKYELHLT